MSTNIETMAHDRLLERVYERGVSGEFNRGILTADRYVRTLHDCVGSDLFYRYAAKGTTSFHDMLKQAARTLTYNDPGMVFEGPVDRQYKLVGSDGSEETLKLPKNTLMAFRHTLTTPRKDRDGDILRSEGARPDPKMLLLWQHVSTLPIGKLVVVEEHSTQRLSVVSAIVDLNELAHDAAVMIDNGMGRFSHGFRALEFEEIKDSDGGLVGFDVKSFEVMEESLVSVPSNVDAEVQDILVGLVERGQLKSAIVKEMGRTLRRRTPPQIPVELDVRLLVNGSPVNQEASHGQKHSSAGTGGSGTCGCTTGKGAASTPKEADAGGEQGIEGEKAGSEDAEVDQKAAHVEGQEAATVDSEDAKSTRAGYIELEGAWEWIQMKLAEKAKAYLIGQGVSVNSYEYVCLVATFAEEAILAAESYDKCVYYRAAWSIGEENSGPKFTGDPEEVGIEVSTEVVNKLVEIRAGEEGEIAQRVALILERRKKDEAQDKGQVSAEEAMGLFVAKSDGHLRKKMADVLVALERSEESAQRTKQFRRYFPNGNGRLSRAPR